MSYYKNMNGIDCFEPDNDATTLYIRSSCQYTLLEIFEKCKDYFKDNISLGDIEITSANIHTDCLSYDQYDSWDYTDFIICTLIKE